MKSLKAKFRKTDAHEWSKNDERLLSAVEHGETDKVSSLLAKKGASATKLDGEGKSALHVAATRGQTECLAVILAHGADLSVLDASGSSALHLAAKNNQQECAKKLLQSKCVLDVLDAAGRTALHYAAANGNAVMVQLLCEHKSPINLRDTDGVTPLLLSAKHAHPEVCGILLDWGAEINACDKDGRTAVMLAAESRCVAAVDLLVHRGADLRLVDSLGHNVLHYAKLSGCAEVQGIVNSALQCRPSEPADQNSPRTPQHDHRAKLNEDRNSSSKKRKAPPPPISPLQSPLSPPYLTPSETPVSSKSGSSKRFSYKEDELRSVGLKVEIEKLQEEKNMLLETIEDLKQIVEQTEPKKRPAPQGKEGRGDSRPNSIGSNASYRSSQAEFDEQEACEELAFDLSGAAAKNEVMLLKDALQNLHVRLDESRLENRSLKARLKPDYEHQRKNGSEGPSESAARKMEDGTLEDQVVRKFQYLKSCLEQEVKDLKAKLAKAEEERTRDAGLIKELQDRLEQSGHVTEDERQEMKTSHALMVENIKQEKALMSEKYEEAQEEIKMLQEALRGTVSVEAAAKDFEEMKVEMGSVISGLQKRLKELSKSYSDTKNELSGVRSKLQALESDEKNKNVVCSCKQEHEEKLAVKMKDVQNTLKDVELKHQSALKEIARLKKDAEIQSQSSVSVSDHTQVVASLGNAVKNLEAELDAVKHQLLQKTAQVDELQTKLKVMQERNVPPDSLVSVQEHRQMKESLEGDVAHLTQLLQDALRKQDELALEVTAAWQEVKDGRSERESAHKQAVHKEQENSVLSRRCKEAQDVITQLKKQVENHVGSEREKNKKIDDLTKEVGKLKDALNSLSQLSYSTSSPKRQQNQQVDCLQQQIKQLQYQLNESKKRHHEIVSVYRMHLLYAVQGQMDEDVQKALQQILVMCKIPTEDK
ncbi:ankycorbin isoform X1 [Trichomycterus rosablanca]|uniref:ankycorbin isoform X1 n=1 Tax=Trichomycterus rosablanca TaxID=2290929 RepID=UPI002F35A466